MALKTPLKLKNKPQPRRDFPPLPVMKPLSSATPKAPTGQIERWLVTHKATGGVLGIVWDHYWFGARARAEWFYKVPLDALTLRHMPLFEDEKTREHGSSGKMLAERLGMKMHTEPVVSRVDHEAGVIVAEPRHAGQCPEIFLHKNGTGVFCTLGYGHKGEHSGFRKRWKTGEGLVKR